jgi:hypothetical protein
MDLNMKHGYGDAGRDMHMQQGHRIAVWTWACNPDSGMNYGRGHAACTGTINIDMDMHCMDIDMQHEY